jgi:hypothetical protein
MTNFTKDNCYFDKIFSVRFSLICSILASVIISSGTSCKKQTADSASENKVPRKVKFVLYTDKDFSNNNGIITFELSIQKLPNHVLWDSVLAPMKIKDIPGPANKWVIEKWVPGDDPSLLKTGFYYSIENVGNSWFLDSFKVGDTFKLMEYNFQ